MFLWSIVINPDFDRFSSQVDGSLLPWFVALSVVWFLGSFVLWFLCSLVPCFLGSLVPGFLCALVSWFLCSWFLGRFHLLPSLKGFGVWLKSLRLKLETRKDLGFGLNPPFETRKGLGFGLNPISETRKGGNQLHSERIRSLVEGICSRIDGSSLHVQRISPALRESAPV